MHHFRRLTGNKKQSSLITSSERTKNYMKHGSGVLEALLALCNGNCRIPIRYFTASEINRATQHSQEKNNIVAICKGYKLVVGSLDKGLVLVKFDSRDFIEDKLLYRDIAITCQMSHLKNVLRLTGCCLEFEAPLLVHEYVEAITLHDLLFNKDNNHDPARKSLLSWGSRLGIANDIASAVVFLHTEFTTPIIHRNLIDQNNGVAKLHDFSRSVSLPPGELQVKADNPYGSFGYIDTEYLRSGIITQKTDVYSFGVVLLALLTRKEVIMDVHDMITNSFRCAVNIEESNVRDTVESDTWVDIEVNNVVDPAILEEHGIGIQQQLENYFDLAKKCTLRKGEDRPYMIEVARELRRIQKCFRAFALAQN